MIRITYDDAVLIRSKNARVCIINNYNNEGFILLHFKRVSNECKEEELTTNQYLESRAGVTVLNTVLTLTDNNFDNLVFAIEGFLKLKTDNQCTQAKQTR